MWRDGWRRSTNVRSSCRQGDVRAVVKGTHGSTFRMGADLDGRSRQYCLNVCSIQHALFAAPPDEAQTGVQDIAQDSSVTMQAIQPDQHVGGKKLVRRRIRDEKRQGAFQFSPIVTIARSPKRAQDVMGMRLYTRGAGSHDFPSLAPLVARDRDLLNTTMRHGQRLLVGERALAGDSLRCIDIRHHPLLAATIPHATRSVERLACHEIVFPRIAQRAAE